MIPILFSPSATTFTTNGIGRLSDAISCVVQEERNGIFTLEMTYPDTGKHFKDIVHSAYIVAKPSARRTLQPFEIVKITKPLNGRITVLAQHISYRLSLIPVSPFSAQNLTNALNGFKTNAAEACPFNFSADFTSASSYAVPLPVSIRSYLGGTRGSILDIYGGEWEFDNYDCILHRNRGQDNGYTIRYGKNLIDLKQEQSIENTYTGIYPYWQSEETMVTLTEKVVHAATAANFPYQRTVVKDFSDKFQNAPTETQLRDYTNSFITANSIGVPNVNLTVDFVHLGGYNNIDLCDTVKVYFQKLDITVTAKVRAIKWNVLKDRYDSIEIGDKRSTLANTIEEQIESASYMATTDDVERTVDRATGVLNSGRRGHVIINRNAEGWANEILFLDNENIAQAVNVLRINMNGIGFSSTGYNGTYSQAWTLDGHFTLGGVNNAYGDFQILDASGVVLGEWDKDGLKFYDSAQNILMQANHTGLYLKDTSNNTIAQLTNQGLNIYRGTISGVTIDIARGNDVGLYCDGQTFQFGDFEVNTDYGRQIIQSVDEMTGMGGEPDTSGGLYLWAGYTSSNNYKFVVNDAGAYTMYNGTPYNIGETLAYILANCCGGGCSSDSCDCDSYEGCDDEDCPGYGGTGCVPEGAECIPEECGCESGEDCGGGESVCSCEEGECVLQG